MTIDPLFVSSIVRERIVWVSPALNPAAPIQTAIQEKLSSHSSKGELHFCPAGVGGSSNQACCVSLVDKHFFCKINSATAFPALFEKEKSGLEFIARQTIISTPQIIACFESEGQQILLLEWIEAGERTDVFWKTFGEQLAALHQCSANFFGLAEDNYMGTVPQRNRQHSSWSEFFAQERLRPITKRCFDKKLLSKEHRHLFERLDQRLAAFFEEEPPSLLHGDLWGGNLMCSKSGQPVLIDPAVYYGHRSTDLAMTTLFGGFRQPFYEAYQYHFPLPQNHEEQWAICNLYPLLIHLYLFGTQYLPQIERTLQRFT